MKTHLNLATKDMTASVAFYSTLLNAKPAKVHDDYALFIVDDPGLELALDLSSSSAQQTDMHFGICVESVADVDSAIERLESIHRVLSVERSETCCYANQTKVWTADPEGRRWEVYTVHVDSEERNSGDMRCCSTDAESRSCCVA